MNHSQFDYDILFIGGASYIVSKRFKVIFDQFLEAWGGLLNDEKGSIFGWNAPIRTLKRIYQIFCIPFKPNWSHFKH